jgi:hypothetical protein
VTISTTASRAEAPLRRVATHRAMVLQRPRQAHWHVTPLCAHVADVRVASHYPMRRRMSRSILQPRSRSCRARQDGNNVWNSSRSDVRATRARWQGEPQMEALCCPPVIQSDRDVCTDGFLPAARRLTGVGMSGAAPANRSPPPPSGRGIYLPLSAPRRGVGRSGRRPPCTLAAMAHARAAGHARCALPQDSGGHVAPLCGLPPEFLACVAALSVRQ